jgi:hypothetical protein
MRTKLIFRRQNLSFQYDIQFLIDFRFSHKRPDEISLNIRRWDAPDQVQHLLCFQKSRIVTKIGTKYDLFWKVIISMR